MKHEKEEMMPGDIVECEPYKRMAMVAMVLEPMPEEHDCKDEDSKYERKSYIKGYWMDRHKIDVGDDFFIVKVIFLPGGSNTFSYPSTAVRLIEKNKTTRKFIEKIDRDYRKSTKLGKEGKSLKRFAKKQGCSKCKKKIRSWHRAKYRLDYNYEYDAFHARCYAR